MASLLHGLNLRSELTKNHARENLILGLLTDMFIRKSVGEPLDAKRFPLSVDIEAANQEFTLPVRKHTTCSALSFTALLRTRASIRTRMRQEMHLSLRTHG